MRLLVASVPQVIVHFYLRDADLFEKRMPGWEPVRATERVLIEMSFHNKGSVFT